MSATLILLDRFKEVRKLETDSEAARALSIHRATISTWRNVGGQAQPATIETMAKAIGADPGGWLALVESERARTEADRKAWKAVAKRLGAAAAVLAVALLAMPSLEAHNTPTMAAETMHYAKCSSG